MRRVAVTGGTGFIGRHMVRRLLDAGVAVNALSRRDDPELAVMGANVVRGSLEDRSALVTLVDGVDAVIHAAGATRARSSRQFVATNAEATGRLAALAAETNGELRFVLLSSLAAREPRISEYAASKRAAEAALQAVAGGMRWTVVRPPAVYGPGDRATLPLFRAMKRGFLPVPGDGRGRFSLIHVQDLVEAVFALLSREVADKQILEVRDGREGGYCWLGLARSAGEAIGRPVRPLHLPASLMRLTGAVSGTICRLVGFSPMMTSGKVGEFFHRDWVCTSNPIAAQTEWHPEIVLTAGFRSTFEWYEENEWI